MESNLNSLTLLIDQLSKRVASATANSTISTIEIDIILDILRQAYLTTEHLRAETHTGSFEVNRLSSLKSAIEPERLDEEQIFDEKKEPLTPEFEPVTAKSYEMPPSSLNIITPVEQVPQMSFPIVEVEVNEPLHVAGQQAPIAEPVDLFITPMPEDEPTVQIIANLPHQLNEQKSDIQKQDTQTTHVVLKTPGDLFGMQTIADKLKSEAPSVIDKINQGKPDQTLAHKMQLKPIADLKNAIGINEKFQFVNDLFEGRIELYNDAISRLNSCGSIDNADNIFLDLKTTHTWNESAEAYNKLRTFVNRRYL